jgi:hypothetical protein
MIVRIFIITVIGQEKFEVNKSIKIKAIINLKFQCENNKKQRLQE